MLDQDTHLSDAYDFVSLLFPFINRIFMLVMGQDTQALFHGTILVFENTS